MLPVCSPRLPPTSHRADYTKYDTTAHLKLYSLLGPCPFGAEVRARNAASEHRRVSVHDIMRHRLVSTSTGRTPPPYTTRTRASPRQPVSKDRPFHCAAPCPGRHDGSSQRLPGLSIQVCADAEVLAESLLHGPPALGFAQRYCRGVKLRFRRWPCDRSLGLMANV